MPDQAIPDQPVPPLPLGEAVRTAREAAGMTVFQVSARTRIRSEILADLEAGRTDSSGGAVYARGHLKAIAAATGSDPAVLLTAHDRATGALPAPSPASLPVPPPQAAARPALARRLPGPRPAAAPVPTTLPLTTVPPATVSSLRLPASPVRERGGPRWGIALLVACAVLVLLVVVGKNTPATAPSDAALPGPAASASPQPPATRPLPVGPSAVASVPAPRGAALRLRVSGDKSWLNVTGADGKTLFRGVVDPGTVKDFPDPASLTVTVGNAGAVSLICGGKDARAGRSGQVRTFTCKRSGLVPA